MLFNPVSTNRFTNLSGIKNSNGLLPFGSSGIARRALKIMPIQLFPVAREVLQLFVLHIYILLSKKKYLKLCILNIAGI